MKFSLSLFLPLVAFFHLGCVQQKTINLHPHVFNSTPRKIIWLQIPGLHEEHWALLKFLGSGLDEKLKIEQMVCFGKTWSYNLYNLRPKVEDGLFSQVTGTQNIQHPSSDSSSTNHVPFWSYAFQSGLITGIFERKTKEGGLGVNEQLKAQEHLKNTILWKMQKSKDKKSKYFNLQKKFDYQRGEVYFDQSCQKEGCTNTLTSNVMWLFDQFTRQKSSYLFLIRDYSLLENLETRNLKAARNVLSELKILIDFFYQLTNSSSSGDILFLVSSTSAMPIDFPEQGNDWRELLDSHSPKLVKTSLLSPVWALGARAENFCGMYEESELFFRIGLPSKRLKRFY